MTRTLARGYTQTQVFMDTPVIIELCAPGVGEDELAERTRRAYGWFAEVERRCSRFDDGSELRRLCRRVGEPVTLSPMLFNALDVSLQIAECTDGALDPTVGAVMERAGFDTNYATGEHVKSSVSANAPASHRDILLDRDGLTATLGRPMTLDLGAMAKGMAIDLAARELGGLPGFVVNAGGDIRALGWNADGEPWRIGIRHPRRDGELLTWLSVSDAAICTSGDYERMSAPGNGHHIRDPRTGDSVGDVLSATVVAPSAMLADALSTAVFVLGIDAGLELLDQHELDGLIVGPNLEVAATRGMEKHWAA